MDRYDPYTDKFLRDTQYGVLGMDVPDINVGDTISRQAVSSWLKQYGQDVLHGKYKFSLMYIWKNLMDLPSAQRKKGKWIEDKGQQTLMQNFIEMGEVWRVCSVCGAGHMIGHKYAIDKAYHDRHHNFCPNCGADMRSENEE